MAAPRLHIYAQQFPHDEAYIVGNREGLESLRKTLNYLLCNEVPGDEFPARDFVLSYANDGEGFHTAVIREDGDDWNKLELPYASRESSELERDNGSMHPYKLIEKQMKAEEANQPPLEGEQ